MRRIVGAALAAGLGLWTVAACAQEAPAPKPDAKALEFFESRIRPLLSSQCCACHSARNVQGGLRLDTAEAFRKGGPSGPLVTPAAPEKSLLLGAVSYTRENLKMPPRGKLKPQQIADLTAWVKMGAPWPSAGAGGQGPGVGEAPASPQDRFRRVWAEGQKHWAFQPVRVPALPVVKNRAWVKSPIDAFILAKLEAKGLKPAPPADRRTLIRRVTYDLTGLPPTPREIDAFLADRSPDAWAKVVDRLLASPAYGERWGRHWLDVARYADSNGLDENTAFGNAWRYRDYVIKSFNEDKPYDRFVREQLAGDLLPQSRNVETNNERLVATGFLGLGPKVLAEPDKQKMVMDIVDEQIDTTGKAFMGLTLGCARCHDHKFDPIPTKDYYGLAGIFKSTRTMETLATVARVLERPLGPPARFEARKKYDAEVRRLTELTKKTQGAEQQALRTELSRLQSQAPPEVPTCISVEEAKEIGNTRVHLRGDTQNLGEEAPRRFLRIVAGENQKPIGPDRSGRLELAEWLTRPDHPLTARVMVNRIWLHHFGEGIVRSPDNFGKLGEAPTHPDLLDWLAAVFAGVDGEKERRREGERSATSVSPSTPHERPWSVKRMHRLMLLSNAYRMSTAYDARAAQVDPENRLFWRFNRRRLEVEAIRDGMLAVTGRLDRTMGGSLLGTPDFAYVTNDQSRNAAQYDTARRSVYLPVIRNAVFDVFQVFDFGDPSFLSGKRASTTVAPQALFLLNGKFVLEQAEMLANEALASSSDDAARVREAYVRAYGRPPGDDEVKAALDYVKAYGDRLLSNEPDPEKRGRLPWRLLAWRSLCQVILASNEFVYIN